MMANDRQTQDPTAPDTRTASAAATGMTDRFGDSAGPSASPTHSAEGPTPADALHGLKAHLSELGEYLGYFLAAKTDGIKLSLRNAGIYAAIGLLGAIAGVAFVATTVVLFCIGVAAALTRLFGGSIWLGTLVTAILFMALLGGGIFLVMKRLTKASRERTVKKYVTRQQQQRANFGTDVEHRSANPANPAR